MSLFSLLLPLFGWRRSCIPRNNRKRDRKTLYGLKFRWKQRADASSNAYEDQLAILVKCFDRTHARWCCRRNSGLEWIARTGWRARGRVSSDKRMTAHSSQPSVRLSGSVELSMQNTSPCLWHWARKLHVSADDPRRMQITRKWHKATLRPWAHLISALAHSRRQTLTTRRPITARTDTSLHCLKRDALAFK